MDLGVVPLSADRLPQPSWPDAKPWDRVLARVQDVIAALSASGSPATADRVRTLAGASDQLVILLSRDRVNLQLLVGGRVVPLDSASKEAILAFVRMESAGADAPQAGAPTQNSLADAAREADVQAQIRDGLGASLPQGAGLPAGASAALSGAFALPPGASPQELARLLTQEQGKPVAVAVREFDSTLRFMKGLSTLDLPETINEDTPVRRSVTRRVPIGVVAALSPWNYPVLLSWWKVVPALLAGNTVVLKPSPQTPLTVLRIGELMADLLPPGVLNVISGGDDQTPDSGAGR